MKNRIFCQFQGFINTPPIFFNENYTELSLFHWESSEIELTSAFKKIDTLPENLVLGKRIEHFFKALISNAERFQILGNNIQIHDAQRTLGEFDFVIKDQKTLDILHIELMYKFYVYDPTFPAEMERWIGPNRKDSLIRKITKVKSNQFPLIHSPEAKKYLDTLAIEAENIQQQILFKAALFIPEFYDDYNFEHINKQCIAGYWYHLSELKKFSDLNYRFYAPEKQDWPIDPFHGEIWYNYSEIIAEIKALHKRKKSPLIWIKTSNDVYEKMIVVWW